MVQTVRKLGPEPNRTQWFIKTGELLMIVAQRKSIPNLLAIVEKHRKILLLGCGTYVTVCLAGGQREVSIIASALRMAAKLKGLRLEVEEATIERQCDNVFLEQAADSIKNNDAVLSLGCGAGVQALAERYTTKPVCAGLDTAFIGILIYQRLKEIGQLDQLKKTKPPKNWRPSLAGGCRTIIREDHRV